MSSTARDRLLGERCCRRQEVAEVEHLVKELDQAVREKLEADARFDNLRRAVEAEVAVYRKAGRSTEDWKFSPSTRECFRQTAKRLRAVLDQHPKPTRTVAT